MRIYKKTYKRACFAATGVLLCLAVLLLTSRIRERKQARHMATMETELEDARRKAEEAVVVRSISRQMEEIAYQQKAISDMQRRKAEQQAEENYRMKLRVEQEWERAVTAQKEAEEAYRMADRQKGLAEERQRQAEQAKRVADTLTYLTLGRSLATTAATLFRTGNPETAALLAYASWSFVKRYGGDRFTPSVFSTLTLVSGQPYIRQCHKGGIGAIVWKGTDVFYSVGRYGEVVEWKADKDGHFGTETLLSDPQLDFRDACLADGGKLYVLSYGGELMVLPDKEKRNRKPDGTRYTRMLRVEKKWWMLTSDGRLVDSDGKLCLPLTDITCAAVFAGRILAGTADGKLLEVHGGEGNCTVIGNIHPEAVTAIACDSMTGTTAWGYADGTVILTDRNGRRQKNLVGHRSAVTGLVFFGSRLCSCSHDRTLRLWNLQEERAESVTALETDSWLFCMALSPDRKTLLAGDAEGRVYSLSLSPDETAELLRRSFRRELTRQEWEYYIGKGIPYETYRDKKQ